MKYLNILIFGLIILFVTGYPVRSQNTNKEPLAKDIPQWFPDSKFGVFVHFAVNGHFRYFTDTSKTEGKEHNSFAYTRGARYFTLEEEDVKRWTDKIAGWGARYAVLTTKHRPGFALWDTEVHSRNMVEMAPCNLDVVDVWTESLRKKGVKVGFYFSHYDWGDEDFITAKSQHSQASAKEKEKAWQHYLEKRNQMVKELVTQYGDIDLIWWDEDWCAKDYKELGVDPMLDMVFKQQPDVVINNRNRHPWRWHYATPEKYVPGEKKDIPWETCDNLTQETGWGYNFPYGYDNYRTPDDILRMFLNVISQGGNYLLNIGPRPDGVIPEPEKRIMNYLGDFINRYSEAIYRTRSGLPGFCYHGTSTRKGNEIYLFADNNPETELTIKGVAGTIQKVIHMGSGKQPSFRRTGGRPEHGHPSWIRIETFESKSPYPEVYKLVFKEKPKIKL